MHHRRLTHLKWLLQVKRIVNKFEYDFTGNVPS